MKKTLYNKGIYPVIAYKSHLQLLVIHPRKELKVSADLADDLVKKYDQLEILEEKVVENTYDPVISEDVEEKPKGKKKGR